MHELSCLDETPSICFLSTNLQSEVTSGPLEGTVLYDWSCRVLLMLFRFQRQKRNQLNLIKYYLQVM